MSFADSVLQSIPFNTYERFVIIGGKLSNSKGMEYSLIDFLCRHAPGTIEFVDPTGKTLIHTKELVDLINEFNTLVLDFYEFLDLDPEDEDFKEQLKNIGKEALKDEMVAFMDSQENKAIIDKLRQYESYSLIHNLIKKFSKGTPSVKRIDPKTVLTSPFLSRIKFTPSFVPQPDISSRTLIIIFNSSSTSIPKSSEIISIIKNKNDNVLVIEPSVPKTHFFRITDLYPENYTVSVQGKRMSAFRNFSI
jgi:hypothetical protein